MPFFSIIIPVYNRKELVIKAIDSVLNQTFTDYELIVVNDGSTDDTSEIKTLYNKKIRYLEQTNLGVSAARNLGIKKSKGKYIALLDSDDYWLPEKLARQFAYIKQYPEIKIHQSQEVWMRNGLRVNPKKIHQKKAGHIFKESLQLCLISPSAVVLERELFDRYGLFDEKMPVCEDYDLWLRIGAHQDVGLLDEFLIVKTGGHTDQLSRRERGMDRFRIYAMLKLFYSKCDLQLTDRKALQEMIIKKTVILIEGARKRSNKSFAFLLEKIINHLQAQSSSNIDYSFLLQEQHCH